MQRISRRRRKNKPKRRPANGRDRHEVNAAEFVAYWQRAKTLEHVARKFGKTRRWAFKKATWLRKHGVRLKYFQLPRIPLPVRSLNRIATAYAR